MTVSISSRRPVRAKLVDESPPGFAVASEDLSEALARPDAGLCIAASRHGTTLTVARLGSLVERIQDRGVTVAFGAPERGLKAVLGLDQVDATGGFDLWLDTVPDQGSEVVRTEEAMFATLAPLNLT